MADSKTIQLLGEVGGKIKSINGIAPDENGNLELDFEGAVANVLIAFGLAPVILDPDGYALTDQNGAILLNA